MGDDRDGACPRCDLEYGHDEPCGDTWTSPLVTAPTVGEARAWIAECMRIHQQWIDHHDEHADAGETCEHAEVAGDREHHVRCNERYEAVVAALGEVRP